MTVATEPTQLERVIPGMGTLQFVESERKREYWLLPEDGQRRRRLPSVTTILRKTWPKPGLLEWYAREGTNVDTVLEASAKRGRAVHTFVETFMSTGDILPFGAFPDNYVPYLSAIARFLWDYNPVPLAVERLVAYPELNYAGRLDLIAELDDGPGVRTLLDFKSNPKGRVYPEAHIQGHAYALADERCGEPKVERILIVGVDAAGDYHVQDGADASKIWGSVLDFYKTLARFDKELEKVTG